jgi:hypothetical protein
MSLEGKAGFLGDRSEDVYVKNVLRRSLDAAKSCLKDEKKLIEIEFPGTRRSDPSYGQTFDNARDFTREFLKDREFADIGKDLWVLFPEPNECTLAKKSWGNVPFTITSIAGALSEQADSASSPKIIICIAPGFNVEEWIDLAKIEDKRMQEGAALIVINGNLDRLRNGFYPGLFYPKIASVGKTFYNRFEQALYFSPVAVCGDRLGAWTAKLYNSKWEVLVKSNSQEIEITDSRGTNKPSVNYDVVSSSEIEPKPKSTWDLASKIYKSRTGKMF